MLSGQAEKKPKFLSGRSAVVWSRHYSAHDNDRCDCEQLEEVLGRVPGAQRMVRASRVLGGKWQVVGREGGMLWGAAVLRTMPPGTRAASRSIAQPH